MRRSYWSEQTATLDPEQDYLEIYRILSLHEFPWDLNQALSFALFRTYAVPSIGRLLDATGQFNNRVQRRYDDTALLLEAPLVSGFDSDDGRTALRRINQMHRGYDISNDDMRYVLSTFVVVPFRWIEQFGWRRLSTGEVLATVRYYQALGRHMNIKHIPESYQDFARLMDDYEAEHFGFDEGARRVADSTLGLLNSFYPRAAAPLLDRFSRALMDPPLLAAFHYEDPGPVWRATSAAGLKVRARALRFAPPRMTAKLIENTSRIRSYPAGFTYGLLGTFPATATSDDAPASAAGGAAKRPSKPRRRVADVDKVAAAKPGSE